MNNKTSAYESTTKSPNKHRLSAIWADVKHGQYRMDRQNRPWTPAERIEIR